LKAVEGRPWRSMIICRPIKCGMVMALQFLIGFIVSVINIMIHALVTIGAVA